MRSDVDAYVGSLLDSLKSELARTKAGLPATNAIWNGSKPGKDGKKIRFNASKRVGRMMKICREANADTLTDFVKYYFNGQSEVQMDPDRFEELCLEYAKSTGLPDEDARLQYTYRLFLETFSGYWKEKKIEQLLDTFAKPEYHCTETSAEEDSNYSVDLVVSKDDKSPKVYIQVKPITYLTTTGQKALSEQTYRNNKCNERLMDEQPNASVAYLYYRDVDSKRQYIWQSQELNSVLNISRA